MHGKRPKKKSKRMTLRKKYKIIKKVKEHKDKLKKDKKKHPEKYAKKKKDPGIPNCVPFKAQIIAEAQEAHRLDQERRERMRQELSMRRKGDRDNLINEKRNINNFLEDAENKNIQFELKKKIEDDSNEKFSDRSAKAYYKEFKKVVEASDVVLEVLDARDPQGSRCTPMEEYITKSGKRLVLVLNKADLVPKENLQSWIEYLRMEYPAIIFKASTQSQAKNLSQSKAKVMKNDENLATSNCIGADNLMQLLKNYCRNSGIKTAITVGVVGLPNVGKSSLINSLKRSKSCNVGAVPGVTKNLQKVLLDSKISLLDSPGIIIPDKEATDTSCSLRNVVKVENLEDPIGPVEAILQRAGKEKVMLHYCIPDFKDTQEFLALLGKKRGRLIKGGGINLQATAIIVLNDWNGGKIKYFTRPPAIQKKSDTESDLIKGFDLISLIESEGKIFASLPALEDFNSAVCIKSIGPLTQVSQMDSDDEDEPAKEYLQNVEIEMKEPEEHIEEVEKKDHWETAAPEIDLSKANLKKLQKKVQKKLRKESNRNLKRTDELVDAFGALEPLKENDAYNFKDYFSAN